MRKVISIAILLVVSYASNCAADAQVDSHQVTQADFEQAIKDAEREYADEIAKAESPPKPSLPTQEIEPLMKELSRVARKEDTDLLEDLAQQVETLKNRVKIEKTTLLATQSPRKVKVRGAKTVFNYLDEAVYEVTAAVDHITDIQLKPGEMLTTAPTAGDTVRWNLSVMKSGLAPMEMTHLIIKPLDEGIDTNLVITTDEHIYHLKLKSDSFHMPAVSWNYPEDNEARMQEALRKEESQEITIAPEKLRFSYLVEGRDYDWKPVRVFDDGQKTFIQMPKELRLTEAPVLFLIDENSDPMIVNYRVKGDYYIVDRLFHNAELRVGPKTKVTIELDDGKNFIERIFS